MPVASPCICRASSCKLKVPFISVPFPPATPPSPAPSRSRREIPRPCNSQTTYFPRTVDKVVALSEAHSSPSNFKYTERAFSSRLSPRGRRAVSFILPSRSVTSDGNLRLYAEGICIFLLAMRYSRRYLYFVCDLLAQILRPLDSFLKH